MGRKVVLQPSIVLSAGDTFQDPSLAVDVGCFRECFAVWRVEEIDASWCYCYLQTALDPYEGAFGSSQSYVSLTMPGVYSKYLRGFARYIRWRVQGASPTGFEIRFSLELYLKGPVVEPLEEIGHAHAADGLFTGSGSSEKRGCSRRLW
ncbi:MAG: hypothetical protein FJ125_01715 [Deltaproteobacteria bacterium]|nr:hypothetical protein [Deltaproteobacteria bacterium]